MTTLYLWFYAHFFGGFSCLKMSPRLIVTVIRHIHALSARIADHPLSKLGARQEARDCPPEVLSLHVVDRALSPKTVSHLSGLDMSRVEELLSLHQRPGDHQHLGGDLDPHLRADAFLALAALQQAVVVRPEMAR